MWKFLKEVYNGFFGEFEYDEELDENPKEETNKKEERDVPSEVELRLEKIFPELEWLTEKPNISTKYIDIFATFHKYKIRAYELGNRGEILRLISISNNGIELYNFSNMKLVELAYTSYLKQEKEYRRQVSIRANVLRIDFNEKLNHNG